MGDVERAERAAEQTARRMARTLRRFRDDARQSRSQGLVIPTLDADPPTDDPTVMWRFEDGRLRVRRADGGVDEFTPVGYSGSTGTGSSGTPKPVDPEVKERVKTYSATWGRSMCPQHGPESGSALYYGLYAAQYHGQRRVMLGFDDATIRADLAGSTIRKVELRFHNTHAYYNNGVDVRIGGHKKDTPPGGYSSVRERVFTGHWPKTGGDTWKRVPDWFGRSLRDDVIRGLTINQGTDAVAFYGAMSWGSAKLRITYTVEV
jgi:hypothetical protein